MSVGSVAWEKQEQSTCSNLSQYTLEYERVVFHVTVSQSRPKSMYNENSSDTSNTESEVKIHTTIFKLGVSLCLSIHSYSYT